MSLIAANISPSPSAITPTSMVLGGMAPILVAEIGAAHGVKGLVVVQSYTEPKEGLFAYDPLFDHQRISHKLTLVRPLKSGFLCRLAGVHDRTQAETKRTTKLYIERSQLPTLVEDDDDYYITDLIGLSVRNSENVALGKVIHVVNYGAGDLLVIEPSTTPNENTHARWLCPFSKKAVPLLSVAEGWLQIDESEIEVFRQPSARIGGSHDE